MGEQMRQPNVRQLVEITWIKMNAFVEIKVFRKNGQSQRAEVQLVNEIQDCDLAWTMTNRNAPFNITFICNALIPIIFQNFNETFQSILIDCKIDKYLIDCLFPNLLFKNEIN